MMNTANTPSSANQRPLWSAFLASFLAVCALSAAVHPTDAEARWTRTHAAACTAVNSSTTPYDVSFAIWNDSTTRDMTLLCDLPDTDVLAKTSLRTVNIHGYDGSSSRNVDARACRTSAWATAGACSPIVSSPTGRSHYVLQPNLSVLSGRVTDFGYIWVRLPPKQSGIRSGLRGFYTAD